MALQVIPHQLPTRAEAAEGFTAIAEFQQACQQYMVKGVDFGSPFPGSDKMSLLKPGAEKVCRLAGVADRYEVLESICDYDKGLRMVTIRCNLANLATDQIVTSGMGECSSYESKYRYRWVYIREVQELGLVPGTLLSRTRTGRNGGEYTQYRLENTDIVDQFNTVVKMARKRSLVDAALGIARLSEIFTQDGDDLPSNAQPTPAQARPAPQQNAPQASANGDPRCQDCGAPVNLKNDGTAWERCYGCNQARRNGEQPQQQQPVQRPAQQPQRAPEGVQQPLQPQEDDSGPQTVEGSAALSPWNYLADLVQADNLVEWGQPFAEQVLQMPLPDFMELNGNNTQQAVTVATKRYNEWKDNRDQGLDFLNEPDPDQD